MRCNSGPGEGGFVLAVWPTVKQGRPKHQQDPEVARRCGRLSILRQDGFDSRRGHYMTKRHGPPVDWRKKNNNLLPPKLVLANEQQKNAS